jgi:hypothetical protein
MLPKSPKNTIPFWIPNEPITNINTLKIKYYIMGRSKDP